MTYFSRVNFGRPMANTGVKYNKYIFAFDFDRTVYEGEDGVLAGVSSGKCLVDCATLTPEHMVRHTSKACVVCVLSCLVYLIALTLELSSADMLRTRRRQKPLFSSVRAA